VGKVVITEFVSLDGVFEDPGGSEGTEIAAWSFQFDRGDDGNRFKLDELMAADVQLLGRVTYEGFAAAWPSRKDDMGFAERENAMPKYVVSTTLKDPEWNNTSVIGGDVAEEVSKLKDRYKGDILIAGSGQLVRTLMEYGLIDEYRLMVFPVVLGRGRRLFDGAGQTRLRLTDSKQVGPDGVTILTYVPTGEPQ
jgi:dihydrofolate reductase